MFGLGLPELIVLLVIVAVVIVPIALLPKIFRKAGASGWYSLLMVVPIVNIISLWIFAFKKWPIEVEAEQKG